MRNRSLLLLAAATVFAGAFAEIGCSSDSTPAANPTTAGAGAGTGSGPTSTTGAGMGGSTTGSSAGGGTTGTGTGGGNTGVDCAAYATSYCAAFKKCDGDALFIAAFENETICEAVITASCMNPDSPPVVDPAACTAALGTSCGLFSGHNIPAACKPKPGTVMNNGTCDNTAAGQCAAGFYCYPAMDMTCSYCTQAMIGDDCQNNPNLCDSPAGQGCVLKYDLMSGSTGQSSCEIVSYGQAGAVCFPGTEKGCDSGFVCSLPKAGMNKGGTCTAALAVGAACDPAASLCDTSKGLTCNPTTQVCTALAYVNIGAQCGMVMGVNQMCSNYAICNASSKCEAKVMKGAPCTASPDNCYPGLTCQNATCQVPPAGPACTPMMQ